MPRVVLGLLGLGVAMVFADRAGIGLVTIAAVWALAGVAWLAAAWGGVVLGALAARGRSPRAQLALGQVLAAALAVLTALGLAWLFGPDGAAQVTSNLLLAGGIAAASGWFFAAAVGELVRLRSLGSHVAGQSERGALARSEADRITQASLQRQELLALGLGLGYGACAVVLALMPVLAAVLVPLAAAGAAWWGLRSAGAPSGARA